MDARTEAACPVCDEPLAGRPAQCFRCETPLAQWWTFEDALRLVEAPAASGRPPRAAARFAGHWTMIASATMTAMAIGIAAVVVATRRPEAPVALAPMGTIAPPAPPPSTAVITRPARLTYRVQRGDSLWRIAASLTGDGRRWRELWPQHEAGAQRITPGTVLEVDLGRVAAR